MERAWKEICARDCIRGLRLANPACPACLCHSGSTHRAQGDSRYPDGYYNYICDRSRCDVVLWSHLDHGKSVTILAPDSRVLREILAETIVATATRNFTS